MNYNGWSNEETYRLSLILQNDYDLYSKAMRFKERAISPEVLAYDIKDIVKTMLREKIELKESIGDIEKVDFREIAEAFYNN